MDKKTITLNEVYIAFCSSKSTIAKAITGLILTSTMTPTTVSNLTLENLLNSCETYFKEDEEKTLQNLLKKDPLKIIPIWKLESEGILTFNTPEVTFYLFLYMKEKRLEDLDELSQPLFKTKKNKPLTPSKISSHVTEFNTTINLVTGNQSNHFKSKNLINTFKYYYGAYLPAEPDNKEKLLKLLEGKLSKNSKFYKNAMKNPQDIKKYYETLIPVITARTYNLNEDLKMFNKYFKADSYNHIIINDYYNTHLSKELNLEYGQEELLLSFAKDIMKTTPILNNETQLDKLFKKAMVKQKIFNHNLKNEIVSFYGYYIEKSHSPEHYATTIENTINNMNIENILPIDANKLYKSIIKYIVRNKYYNKNIHTSEAKRIIEEILFEIIDEQ